MWHSNVKITYSCKFVSLSEYIFEFILIHFCSIENKQSCSCKSRSNPFLEQLEHSNVVNVCRSMKHNGSCLWWGSSSWLTEYEWDAPPAMSLRSCDI